MPNPYNESLMAQLDDLYERAAREKEQADLLEQQMRFREWAQDYTRNQEPGIMDRISSIYQRFSPKVSPFPHFSLDQLRGLTEGALGGIQEGPEGAVAALAGETQPRGADFFEGLSPGWQREVPGALLEMAVDPTNLATGGAAGLLKGLVGKGGMGLAMAAAPRLMRKGAREAVEEGAGFFNKTLPGAFDDVFEQSAKTRGGYADEGISAISSGGGGTIKQGGFTNAEWDKIAGAFKARPWQAKLAQDAGIPRESLVPIGTPGAEIVRVPYKAKKGGKIVDATKEIYVRPGTKNLLYKNRKPGITPDPKTESANRVLQRQQGVSPDFEPGSLEHALYTHEAYFADEFTPEQLYQLYERNPVIQKMYPELVHFRPPKSGVLEDINAKGLSSLPDSQFVDFLKATADFPAFMYRQAKEGLSDLGERTSNAIQGRLLGSVGPRDEPSIMDVVMDRVVQGPRKKTYGVLDQAHSQKTIPKPGTPEYQALRRANAEGRLPPEYFGRSVDPWQKNLYLALRDVPKTDIPTLVGTGALGIGGVGAVIKHALDTGPQEAYDPVTNRWENLPEDYSGEQGRVYRDPEEVYNVGMETQEDPREQYSLAGAMLKRLSEGLGGSWGISPEDDPRVVEKKRQDRIRRLEKQIQLMDMTGQDTTELQEELERMTMPNQNWMPAEQAEEAYNRAVDKGYLQSLQEIQDIEQRGYEPEYSPGWIRYVPYMNYVPALNTMIQRWHGEGEPPPLPQEPEPELFRPNAVNPRTELPYPWVPGDNPYL